MLNNIKSFYTIKILFNLLTELKKFKIVKYNKNLQNLLNINFFNYALFSGKYIEYQQNGLVKIYNGFPERLIYEGEYSKGMRNGKGKEYERIKYEGEYKNGKKNGKGKEYDFDDSLIFEGEYLNGERNGKGKDFYWGKLKFDGEYLNGKKWKGIGYNDDGGIIFEINNDNNGKVKEYDKYNYLLFDGELLNGEKNGKGKEYYDGHLVFEGEYLNGKRNGQGKEFDIHKNYKFEGEFFDDFKWNGKAYDKTGNIIYEIKNGKGKNIKEYNHFGVFIFEGEYLNGKRNGKGKERENNFILFDGEYLNGERNGRGKEFKSNKLRFEGEYLNGKRIGKGKEYSYDGELKFEGEYLNDKRNGKGKEFYAIDVIRVGERDINEIREINEGKLIFEGEFLYDYRLKGKAYVNGKLEYEGEYLFNKKWNGKGYDENGNIIYEIKKGNGKVKEYHPNGRLIFEGEYLNGKKNGKGKEYSHLYHHLVYEGEFVNGERTGKAKVYESYTGKKIFEGEYSEYLTKLKNKKRKNGPCVII